MIDWIAQVLMRSEAVITSNIHSTVVMSYLSNIVIPQTG